MRIAVFAMLICGMLSACSSSEKKPADLLPKDKMEKVLWDMVLADRFSSQYLLKDSLKVDVKTETFRLYEEVFAIHKINRDQFISSYKYYLNHPQVLKVMFDSISVRANRDRKLLFRNNPE